MVLASVLAPEPNLEFGKFIHHRVNIDCSPVLIKNTVANTQAEPHAFADIIFSEKRLEYSIDIFRWDTAAIISHDETNSIHARFSLQAKLALKRSPFSLLDLNSSYCILEKIDQELT